MLYMFQAVPPLIIRSPKTIQYIKFINAKQAKEKYQYRNIKTKLYKGNAAIWYNKILREKQRAPKYISIMYSF
jgi:hypothetical protein